VQAITTKGAISQTTPPKVWVEGRSGRTIERYNERTGSIEEYATGESGWTWECLVLGGAIVANLPGCGHGDPVRTSMWKAHGNPLTAKDAQCNLHVEGLTFPNTDRFFQLEPGVIRAVVLGEIS
jgi:hypothetical protein